MTKDLQENDANPGGSALNQEKWGSRLEPPAI